ncbi:MAG: hypothetical protein AAF891_05550 [Pseudomonadota bacterium]
MTDQNVSDTLPGIDALHPDTRLARIVTWSAIALSLVLACVVAFNPITYNTRNVPDATFLAQIGRWMQEGAMPGVDFGHFYGGMHEWFVAQGLHLSGGTIKALDYALVLEFIVVALGLQIVAWRRLDALTTALLTLLCAVVLFARQPLESTQIIIQTASAHSFAYNRLGTALTIIAAALLLVRSESRWADIAAGAVAGVAVTAAMLAKATFFPVAIVLLLGLAITARWPALIAAVLAGILFGVINDPTGARSFSTLAYSAASSGSDTAYAWLFTKAVQLVFSQQLHLLLILALVFVLLQKDRSREMWTMLGLALALLMAFWATSVTMGVGTAVGHQAAPVLAALAVLIFFAPRDRPVSSLGLPLVVVLYAAFVLPQGLNFAGSTASGLLKADRVIITEGPLKGYLAGGKWLSYRTDTGAPASPISQVSLDQTAQSIAAGIQDAGIHYVQLMDAVRLMEDIPNRSEAALVSDTRLGLNFATGTSRVEGYPQWLRRRSPELAEGKDPLANVNLILLNAATRSGYSRILRRHMGDDFTLCKQSPIWFLYVRKSDSNRLCPGT